MKRHASTLLLTVCLFCGCANDSIESFQQDFTSESGFEYVQLVPVRYANASAEVWGASSTHAYDEPRPKWSLMGVVNDDAHKDKLRELLCKYGLSRKVEIDVHVDPNMIETLRTNAVALTVDLLRN